MRIRVPAVGPYISKGSELLHQVMVKAGLPQAAVAAEIAKRGKIKCHGGYVNRWLHGFRRPSITHIIAMQELYKIPADAWTRPTSKNFKLERNLTLDEQRALAANE